MEIAERLGSPGDKAHTLWKIAQIGVQRQQFQSAYEHLTESYQILLHLGRLDGICMVGLDLGKLLCAGGHMQDGLAILTRSRDGFRQLGQVQMAEHTQQLIHQLESP